MSSYLLELTAGELERITGEVDGVEIGVIATSGKREQGRFALASAIDLLRYLNDYFGVKYPLPKLDLIAIPHGAVRMFLPHKAPPAEVDDMIAAAYRAVMGLEKSGRR